MPAGSAPVSDAAGFTVRAVAERLGIPTATLRSWNRRYNIGPPQDRPGKHRLYSERDIALLGQMVTLIRDGATPAGAAAAVRGPLPVRGDRITLLDAAFALDTTTVSGLLTAHVRDYGVVATWDELCRPAFADIIARQFGGEGCIDVEHLLSWCVTSILHRTVPPPDLPAHASILLACTSGETHALPLEVLRAALAERGVGARMLGADVPTTALLDALARHADPTSVVLWSQQESTALTSAARACAGARAAVFVGGPGWDEVILPERVTRLTSLVEATDRLTAASQL
ncbi:MerR family transcriptional regulator [Nocardia bovistercoris]|uniref:MerR family transcriptional regulator n=1 Tax=Nocardia bovistercoris TaxID=2785916 RepID=A0A931I684_9NOCA|nr:MerR family transcriptional regulator [Nocardia bovistercoris]MBH0775647.1 MerR family transcriptional regulator [Nocardia bovistercoris]